MHSRTEWTEPSIPEPCVAGMLDRPLSDISMLSREEASTQNICEKLGQQLNSQSLRSESEDTYLSAISSVNLRQIWVFPIPPIPQRRQERLDLLLARFIKILPSLSSTSFRPVNNGLGFGFESKEILISSPVLARKLLTI